jgi:hypothetical protein
MACLAGPRDWQLLLGLQPAEALGSFHHASGAHVSRLGWESVGCEARLVPDRLARLAPTKDAPAITPPRKHPPQIYFGRAWP